MKKTAIILAIIISLFCLSSCQSSNEPETNEPIGETSDTSITQGSNKAEGLYSEKDWTKYFYLSDSDNEAIKLLEEIHSTEHGTAGSSGKELAAGCKFILLSKLDSSKLEAIPEHLSNMTELQLDFLSYQLSKAFETAQAIVQEDESTIKELDVFGLNKEDYSDCEMSDLSVFMEKMTSFLSDCEVEYLWCNIGEPLF